MDTIKTVFGEGKDLDALQMSARALAISLVCLVLIRFSGRRSFSQGTPFDNVAAILLGAILSRTVVGATPFLSTVSAATTIAVLHRAMAWLGLYSDGFGRIVKGEAKIVYENGSINEKNMYYCRITRKDLMAGVRQAANVNSLEQVDKVYVERSGRISVVKKEKVS